MTVDPTPRLPAKQEEYHMDTPTGQSEQVTLSLPRNDYQIIYADPPWQHDDRAAAGKRGAAFKYKTMSLSDIKQLPISDYCADNCVLFMWHVAPMPQEALDVVRAWGFKLKTFKGFTWVKQNKKADSYFMGMGNWTRANSEDCLIAVRGNPKRVSASVRQIVVARLRGHSQKPDEVRDRIVELMGDVPRVELFARQRVAGWDYFGDQILDE